MFRAYLQLFRIPNIFSAIADIAAGYLLVHASFVDWPTFAGLLACSCFLYASGLVLNDVYDVDVDRCERPDRPLPTGTISVAWASRLGYILLASGIAIGWFSGLALANDAAHAWRSGLVASILALCIVSYDRWLKRLIVAPIAMGVCRFLNVLLGASTASFGFAEGIFGTLSYTPAQLTAAGGIGIYILGVTAYARTEAHRSNRWHLFVASLIIVVGIGVLGLAYPPLVPVDQLSRFASRVPTLSTVLAMLIGWRCLRGAVEPSSGNVQAAVKVCLMSLIVLDAMMCLVVRDATYALGILTLLVPTILLGRWISAT